MVFLINLFLISLVLRQLKLLFLFWISEAYVMQVLSLPDPVVKHVLYCVFFLNVSGAELNWHIQ